MAWLPFKKINSEKYGAINFKKSISRINLKKFSNFFPRCRFQEQGARDYSQVVFECPSPGISGNTITVQSIYDRIYIMEIEVLGETKDQCTEGWQRSWSQPPDKPKPVWYAMKLDLNYLARLALKWVIRYKLVGIKTTWYVVPIGKYIALFSSILYKGLSTSKKSGKFFF